MNNQSIGILDSGVGGLSIWKEIVAQLPNESTIYIGDSKNCPYGVRSGQEIYILASKMVKFLLSKKVKLIVIACNTITVTCLEKLRLDFSTIPIIGIVPVVKTAAEKTKNKKIGVLSTIQTSNSKHQKDLIEKFAKNLRVTNIGTDKLVPFVERGEVDSEKLKDTLKKELESFTKAEIDVLALGCSHFPFLKNSIQKILGKNVLVLNSGAAIARQVVRVLGQNNALAQSQKPFYYFYTTGNTKRFSIATNNLVKQISL